jgi:RHS repeat-associated protein
VLGEIVGRKLSPNVINSTSMYRLLATFVWALLSVLAPRYALASISHRTTSPFPDRAQHAERHGLSSTQRDQYLNSNPNPAQRVGARDVGKAAAERRWVGASPTQTNDGDVAAISVFTRPAQRLKAEYGKGGRLLKKREWSFEYDARGRRVAKVRTLAGVEERTEYEWDGRDKLRTIRKPDGTRLDYSYDVFGRRVRKTRSGGPLDEKRVEYVWDGEVLAWELDTERGPRTFVHEPGGFEPILQQQSGETYLCVNDHLGMPKELIDGEGNLAWAGAHSAYGAVIATQGPDDVAVDGGFVQSDGPRVESPFRLLGQVNDEDAELAWTRFRCFDADTGTWISTDPLEIAGGLNLYGFDGSPSDVVDPFGLSTSGHNHEENSASVKKLQEKFLEKQGLDVHGLKEDFVGREDMSKFDIANNTDTGTLVIVPHRKGGDGGMIDTGMTLEEAAAAYPRATSNKRGKGNAR